MYVACINGILNNCVAHGVYLFAGSCGYEMYYETPCCCNETGAEGTSTQCPQATTPSALPFQPVGMGAFGQAHAQQGK